MAWYVAIRIFSYFADERQRGFRSRSVVPPPRSEGVVLQEGGARAHLRTCIRRNAAVSSENTPSGSGVRVSGRCQSLFISPFFKKANFSEGLWGAAE